MTNAERDARSAQLFARLKEDPDNATLKWEIVLLHRGLVGWCGNGRWTEDQMQVGLLGLHHAVEKFDPSMGYKFATYAQWWIRQAVWKYTTLDVYLRLPHHCMIHIGDVVSQTIELGRPVRESDTDFESASRFPNSSRIVHRLDLEFQTNPLAAEGDAVDALDMRRLFRGTWLSVREADILASRFLWETTLAELGARWGISRERIRQLESRLVYRLRKDLRPSDRSRPKGIRYPSPFRRKVDAGGSA